ncbi:MAG: ABC transporter ATP-binding protein [Flavobacteriales bacterium]|nr:ABC transporter ATP-binding protein [Flavobacteriales bacterium]
MSYPLHTKALAVGHGQQALLRDLDLILSSGQLVSIIGRNGSGKSTLLRTLCGSLPPVHGEVFLGDASIGSLSAAARARLISIVFTGRSTLGQVSVLDAVAMGRHPWTSWTGRTSERDERAVSNAMEQTGTGQWARRLLHTLSDGEHQKVMIARALAQDTPALLLDEPKAFLDLTSRVHLMRMLKRIAVEGGKSILLSTHDLQLALDLSDGLLLISNAGTCWQGTPSMAIEEGLIAREFDDAEVRFDPERAAFRPR